MFKHDPPPPNPDSKQYPYYGTTRAARQMQREDRNYDLLSDIASILNATTDLDPIHRLEMLLALKSVDRRKN